MKRLLAIVMAVVMCAACVTACSKSKDKSDETTEGPDLTVVEITPEVDPGDVPEYDGPMFVIRNGNAGEYSIDSDCWTSTYYTVYHNGSIERCKNYTISDSDIVTTVISGDDFDYIRNFAENALESDEFDDYHEDVCDGDTYTFEYYDEEGNCNRIYSGYCYSNEALQDILSIVRGYFS